MGRKKGKKKFAFLFRHAKCFLSAKFITAALVLAGLSAVAAGYIIYEKKLAGGSEKVSAASELTNSSMPARTPASTVAAFFEDTAASTPIFLPLDLSYDIGVYVYSKKKHVCNDYRNVMKPNYFSMRCKVADGVWRGHLVKKIDVAGYSKLRVKAGLGINDYTDYFAECGHQGVNRDDFIALAALSYDPQRTFDWDCNHEVVESKWSMCQVQKIDPGVIAYCGVPMCTKSRSCDLEIDVSKERAIYLLFSVNDAWVADIEGSLSNVQYALIK
jgi:hypothetical protein